MTTHLIMIDGLRPEAVTAETCPNLTGLMARGSYTRRARSVLPCITLPCHMSIYHSVPPQRHGVTTNTFTPMARPLPGLMEVARAANKRCAFFYNWEPLRNVSLPGSLAHSFFIDNVEEPEGDSVVAAEAARTLAANALDFAFIYFGAVDVAGHNHGWMSPGYLSQAAFVDGLLGRLLAELPPESHFLVQADHGGIERNHGTDLPENMTIPWVLAGPGVRAGHEIQGPVSLLDTAPTLARLLGVAAHPHWEGRAVDEAFS
jgi:predicted AlkP superfamily pyrophosphatase or phosphodiesterase